MSDLVAALAGGRPAPGLSRLAAGAAGNPLYVTELVGALGRANRLVVDGQSADITAGPVPATPSEAIADRLGFMSDAVRNVLQAAALFGNDFTVDDLAVVTGRRPAELAPAIEDARSGGVLVDSGLVDNASVLLGEATPVGVELLEAATGRAPTGDVRRAPLICLLADGLCRLGRQAEAALLAEQTLPGLDAPGLFTTLSLTLARCRLAAGRYDAAAAGLRTALERPGLTYRQRVVLRVRAVWTDATLKRIGTAEEQAIREALSWAAAEDDAEGTGTAMYVLAACRAWEGDEYAARELYEQALATVDGHPELADLQLQVQLGLGLQLGVLDLVDAAEDRLRRAVRLAHRTGNLARRLQAQTWLVALLLETGRWDDMLAEAVAASELHAAYMRCQIEGSAALVLLHRGDSAGARRHLNAAATFVNRLEGRLVGYLCLARALDLERSDTPGAALDILVPPADGDIQEIETVLADAVRLAVALGNPGLAAELTARAIELPSSAVIPHRAAVTLPAGDCLMLTRPYSCRRVRATGGRTGRCRGPRHWRRPPPCSRSQAMPQASARRSAPRSRSTAHWVRSGTSTGCAPDSGPTGCANPRRGGGGRPPAGPR